MKIGAFAVTQDQCYHDHRLRAQALPRARENVGDWRVLKQLKQEQREDVLVYSAQSRQKCRTVSWIYLLMSKVQYVDSVSTASLHNCTRLSLL